MHDSWLFRQPEARWPEARRALVPVGHQKYAHCGAALRSPHTGDEIQNCYAVFTGPQYGFVHGSELDKVLNTKHQPFHAWLCTRHRSIEGSIVRSFLESDGVASAVVLELNVELVIRIEARNEDV